MIADTASVIATTASWAAITLKSIGTRDLSSSLTFTAFFVGVTAFALVREELAVRFACVRCLLCIVLFSFLRALYLFLLLLKFPLQLNFHKDYRIYFDYFYNSLDSFLFYLLLI